MKYLSGKALAVVVGVMLMRWLPCLRLLSLAARLWNVFSEVRLRIRQWEVWGPVAVRAQARRPDDPW